MAKGKFISENEREVIRVGVHFGIQQKVIAKSLNRTPAVVCQQIAKMRAESVIDDLPLPFMAEIIRKGLIA